MNSNNFENNKIDNTTLNSIFRFEIQLRDIL